MDRLLDQLGVPAASDPLTRPERNIQALDVPLPAGTPLPPPTPLFRKIDLAAA
jgi:hypothetical protein